MAPASDGVSNAGRSVVQCQNEKAFPEGNPLPFTLMAWSVVHGIAKLAVSGHLSGKKEEGFSISPPKPQLRLIGG
jgi:hypothetical protein